MPVTQSILCLIILMWWCRIPCRWKFLGRLMVTSCMKIGGCSVWFLLRPPYFTLDRWGFGLRMIGMLLALTGFCVFPLRLHASRPRTQNWLFSMMTTNCLGERLPAAMTDGWFLPVKAVPSAGLWNTFSQHTFLHHHDHAFLLETRWRRLFWACKRLILGDVASPAQLHLKQDGLHAGQADCLEDFFVWHVLLPFDAKHHWWNRSSSLIYFW